MQRVVIKERGGWRFNEPKTEKSRRAVALPATTIAALKLHRRRQAEERLRAGEAFTDHGFIFANEAGGPLDMRNLAKRHLAPLLVAAKLPKLRLYDLRHMMATVALEGGMHPKVVSERLGHSTIKLTMDTYSHVSDALQHEAAQQLEGLLFATKRA